MNTISDPFNDDDDNETTRREQSSREALASFWICCAGLAIFALAGTLASRFVVSFDRWILSNLFKFPNGPGFWLASDQLHVVVRASLNPGVVLATVVPILYWRGGLAQRFVISVVIAITTMNIATDPRMYSFRLTIPWRQLLAIAMCWAMMPVLFLLTPINTRYLRVMVASGLLLLTLCVSVHHMFEAPRNINLLYWLCLYGAAFCYALMRRNWGRVAILEATSNREQIERTSSRTLLEVMAVSGLACAAVMFWSTEMHTSSIIYLMQASVLGIACVFVSMACIRTMLNWHRAKISFLVALWLAMWVLFSANSHFATFTQGRYQGLSPWQLSSVSVVVIGSFFASLAFVLFAIVIGIWLRTCGWHMHDAMSADMAGQPSKNLRVL